MSLCIWWLLQGRSYYTFFIWYQISVIGTKDGNKAIFTPPVFYKNAYCSCPSLTPPHHTHNTHSLHNALLFNHSFNRGFKAWSLIYQLCRILLLLLLLLLSFSLKYGLVLLVQWREGKNWSVVLCISLGSPFTSRIYYFFFLKK